MFPNPSHNPGDTGGNASGGENHDKDQNGQQGNKGGENKGGEGDGQGGTDPNMVPSHRLKEEADKRRDVEKQYQDALQKIAAYDDAKKIQDEAESVKKGEFEKVLTSYKDQVSSLTAQIDASKKKDAFVQTIADKTLGEFEKSYGKEKLDAVKAMIGSEDPYDIISKIDAAKALIGASNPPAGGQNIPKGGDRKSILAQKTKDGTISKEEQREYLRLLSG